MLEEERREGKEVAKQVMTHDEKKEMQKNASSGKATEAKSVSPWLRWRGRRGAFCFSRDARCLSLSRPTVDDAVDDGLEGHHEARSHALHLHPGPHQLLRRHPRCPLLRREVRQPRHPHAPPQLGHLWFLLVFRGFVRRWLLGRWCDRLQTERPSGEERVHQSGERGRSGRRSEVVTEGTAVDLIQSRRFG